MSVILKTTWNKTLDAPLLRDMRCRFQDREHLLVGIAQQIKATAVPETKTDDATPGN